IDRANCVFDHRGVFNTSFVTAAPRFNQAWMQRLLGNWQLSPWFSYATGLWFYPVTGVDNSRTGVGLDRPDRVISNGLYPSQKSPTLWFNPTAFTANAVGTFGNVGKNSILAPRTVTLNAALTRYFPVGEQRKFEFRFEAFNALNHANFGLPTSAMTS